MHRKKTTDAPLADRTRLSRRAFLKKMGFASLVCAFVLTPWTLSPWHIVSGDVGSTETIKEKNTMELARNTTDPKITIPPIDAAAPTTTETATFAMG